MIRTKAASAVRSTQLLQKLLLQHILCTCKLVHSKCCIPLILVSPWIVESLRIVGIKWMCSEMAKISQRHAAVVVVVAVVVEICTGFVDGAATAASCAAVLCPVNTYCKNGQCKPICETGYADCNGKLSDGCEVNYLDGDAANCGGCRRKCRDPKPYEFVNCVGWKCQYLDRCAAIKCATYPNADTTCIRAQCRVTCQPGYCNCDGVLEVGKNGCEVNLNTDPNNCGQCGHKCPAKCSNGVCA